MIGTHHGETLLLSLALINSGRLIKHPAIWLVGGASLLLSTSLLNPPTPEGIRQVLWIIGALGGPLFSWLGYSMLNPDAIHEPLQATPRSKGLHLTLQVGLSAAVLAFAISLGLLLAGAGGIVLGGAELSHTLGTGLAAMVSAFFWLSLGSWGAKRSWVWGLGFPLIVWLVLFSYPVLLSRFVFALPLVEAVARSAPFSPLYPFFPHTQPSLLLPLGPVPTWLGWNRVWTGCLGVFLWTGAIGTLSRQQPSWGRQGLRGLAGVGVAAAAGALAFSWETTLAPFSTLDLLKGKAQLNFPYTFDRYGRPLMLEGEFGFAFLDVRPPDAPVPAWAAARSEASTDRLPHAGLMSWISAPDFQLPQAVAPLASQIDGLFQRAFWLGAANWSVGPAWVGLVSYPAEPEYFYLLASADSHWLLSENWLTQAQHPLWSLAWRLAQDTGFNRPARVYTTLYLLQAARPEANQATLDWIRHQADQIPLDLRSELVYLPSLSRPSSEQRQAFQRAKAQGELAGTTPDDNEADLPRILIETQLALRMSEASTDEAQIQKRIQDSNRYYQTVLVERLVQRWESRGYDKGQIQALVEVAQRRMEEIAAAEPTGDSAAYWVAKVKKLQTQQEQILDELLKGILHTPESQLSTLREELLAEVQRITQERLQAASTSPAPTPPPYPLEPLTPYSAWLILQYWQRGEQDGHLQFLQAALEGAL